MKRAFLYVRVSTQEQAREGYSIDEQIDRLKNYAKAMKWSIVDTYVDAGFSGAKTDRPALQDLLKDIRSGKGDIVCVYKLDRLSRSQKDTLSLIEDNFLANNVDFVSMTENFDTSTPFGRAMIGILSVFAQLEREQIKERMKMGKAGRAKEGKFHGGHCPIGYDYIDGNLVINEYEAMQIREAHELFQKGTSFREIERIFASKGYSEKYGAWTTHRIRVTLLNDLYVGMIKSGGETFKGEHEPIIDLETYEATKRIYEERGNKNIRNQSWCAYLSGILYCGRCGARYGLYKAGKNRYYGCYSRRKRDKTMVRDANCKNKIWRADDLDELILNEIKKLADDPACIHEMRQNSASLETQNKILILQKEIDKIDSQKSRFLDLYGLGEFTADELTEKVKPLNDRKQALADEIIQASRDDSAITEDEAVKIVESFEDILERGDFNEIRLLIYSLIDKIEIDGDDVDIFWKFA